MKTKSAIEALMKALEVNMYGAAYPLHEAGLRRLLDKLDIKSADYRGSYLSGGGSLQMESLEGLFGSVTFQDVALGRWKK